MYACTTKNWGFRDVWQGEGGQNWSKIVTYFMDGPILVLARSQRNTNIPLLFNQLITVYFQLPLQCKIIVFIKHHYGEEDHHCMESSFHCIEEWFFYILRYEKWVLVGTWEAHECPFGTSINRPTPRVVQHSYSVIIKFTAQLQCYNINLNTFLLVILLFRAYLLYFCLLVIRSYLLYVLTLVGLETYAYNTSRIFYLLYVLTLLGLETYTYNTSRIFRSSRDSAENEFSNRSVSNKTYWAISIMR